MDTNSIKKQISEMTTEISKIQSKYRSEIKVLIEEGLQTLKETYPDLDAIYIRGYTPGFNDGEECTHTTNVYVDNSGHYSDIAEFFECVLNEDFDWMDLPVHIKKVNSKLSTEDAKEIRQIIRKLEDTFEEVFSTNWYMIIDFTSEKVSIDFHDDYDCGY